MTERFPALTPSLVGLVVSLVVRSKRVRQRAVKCGTELLTQRLRCSVLSRYVVVNSCRSRSTFSFSVEQTLEFVVDAVAARIARAQLMLLDTSNCQDFHSCVFCVLLSWS